MKVTNIKKLKDNRYEITFNDNLKLKFYDDIIVKYNLLSKQDFDSKFIERIEKENDEAASFYQAIKYINIKLRSEKEIKKYLEKKEFVSKNIENTINKLKEKGFINNELYIKSYINDQVHLSNNGYYKIQRDLCNLGFEEDEILAYLNTIEEEVWSDKLNKLITKKIKLNHKYSGRKLIDKLTYDLFNLGYAKDMIINLLENYTFDDTNLLEKEYNKVKRKLEGKFEGIELEYKIKAKLISKGFNSQEIASLIAKEKNI